MSKQLIPALAEGSAMRYFLRLFRKSAQGGHDAEAAARLALCLGARAADYVRQTGLSVHDAGINLPSRELAAEEVKFLFRYAHRAADAARVVTRWEILTGPEFGVNPLGKGGLEAALDCLASMHFEDTKHREFSRVAALAGLHADSYPRIERFWLEGLEGITHQTVPDPGCLVREDLRLSQLRKDDPRAVFAGVFTGCCQHPEGVGASSAWHAHSSPDGAIWAVERNGKMVAQAWVWRGEQALVLDSIEATASIGKETQERVRELFRAAAKAVIGKLCVTTVYMGAGSGIGPHRADVVRPNPVPRPAGVYSDAESVWVATRNVGV